jgi:uncharacterized protein YaiI (UPF0178 family)
MGAIYKDGEYYSGGNRIDHFIIQNQALTFTQSGNSYVATVQDDRVTSDSLVSAFFVNASLQAAADANVVVDSASGSIVFTADSAIASTLYVDIIVRN